MPTRGTTSPPPRQRSLLPSARPGPQASPAARRPPAPQPARTHEAGGGPSARALSRPSPKTPHKASGCAREGLSGPAAESGDASSGGVPRPRNAALFPTAEHRQTPPYRRETLHPSLPLPLG